MTTKAELENLAANLGKALGTSVYYWKESGVHSFYPGEPNSHGRSMKLLGEYSAPKLYDAGEKFLDGFNKGAMTLKGNGIIHTGRWLLPSSDDFGQESSSSFREIPLIRWQPRRHSARLTPVFQP